MVVTVGVASRVHIPHFFGCHIVLRPSGSLFDFLGDPAKFQNGQRRLDPCREKEAWTCLGVLTRTNIVLGLSFASMLDLLFFPEIQDFLTSGLHLASSSRGVGVPGGLVELLVRFIGRGVEIFLTAISSQDIL